MPRVSKKEKRRSSRKSAPVSVNRIKSKTLQDKAAELLYDAKNGKLTAYCVAQRQKVSFAHGNARIVMRDNKRTGYTVMICGEANCKTKDGEYMRICRIVGVDKY